MTKAKAQVGAQITVISDMCPIVYENGTEGVLREGSTPGAFSDFVAGSPDGATEGVEIHTYHPETGRPTTATVPASRVQIFTE